MILDEAYQAPSIPERGFDPKAMANLMQRTDQLHYRSSIIYDS